MLTFRPLPWEYGVRNLLRRPGRTALTLAGLTTVVVLIFVVVGFIRGLDASLSVSGDPRVVLVHSKGAQENIEYSSIAASTADLLGASLKDIFERYGRKYASPELYLGTQVTSEQHRETTFGLVRGVTPAVLSVRRQVQILEGNWPAAGEVLIGRLAATKLGWSRDRLAVGNTILFEGRPWRISGWFAAQGSVFESELWCPLADLQSAMKRQDLSLVALTLAPDGKLADVELFCKEQQERELQATPETEYYALLHAHYGPVRTLAWMIVCLVAGAGIFAGLNTMYGAVAGRVRELAMLQTTGFVRRAIALSLVQEGTLLAALGSLIAAVLALTLIHGAAVRFTMGAFSLKIDGVALLLGCGTGLLLGIVGSLPPAIRAMRLPIAEGLKAI
jgi:ABC-type lipoprotein release transport system permease subunit